MSSGFQLTQAWLAANFRDLHGFVPLGRGGAKLVFAAQHATDGDVVLKIVQPSVGAEDIDRERLAVDRVQSTRVPRILAYGTVDTTLGKCIWLREQRINGQTVRALLGTGPLSARELLRLGLHVLEALVNAERAEIVHRDVKPDNIMRDTVGDYWLLDFGVARHLTLSSLTATSASFGKATCGYAPPEQFRNLKPHIDARADLFALGVTIFECAVGTNPFRNGAINELEILRRVETAPLPPLMLPIRKATELRDLVASMTQLRREHRPRSAEYALEWMQEICAAEGI